MKFSRKTAVSTVIAVSLTVQCTMAVQPTSTMIPSDAAAFGAGMTKLEEILLMTPLWRDVNVRFTVDVHRRGQDLTTP